MPCDIPSKSSYNLSEFESVYDDNLVIKLNQRYCDNEIFLFNLSFTIGCKRTKEVKRFLVCLSVSVGALVGLFVCLFACLFVCLFVLCCHR